MIDQDRKAAKTEKMTDCVIGRSRMNRVSSSDRRNTRLSGKNLLRNVSIEMTILLRNDRYPRFSCTTVRS